MHFPDLWYFESVLRSWINANVSMGSQCSLVPNGTRNGQFRASSSTTQCDLLPTMNRTVTLSFRNVSVRRHLVKFAATVAADLPDDRYNDWWSATPGDQRWPTLGRHVLVHDLWSDCRHAADIDRRTIALCDVCRSIPR